MNYPKVCFNCSRQHIMAESDCVTSDDGTKVWHKDCSDVVPIVIVYKDNREDLKEVA